MRRLAILVASVALAVTAVPAASADDGRGHEWVERHPMHVSALVVSMGQPPPGVVADYFGGFGANAVSLWLDGAGEAPGWAGRPFTIWLDEAGTSLEWDGQAWVSTGELLGGLPAAAPGRIGYQVGDEPGRVADIDAIAAGMAAVRAADPEALVYTNLSYFAPEREAVIARWVAMPEGDLQSSSDYFLGPLHYTALERFRSSALAKGVPYWQYLNAYIGSESNFDRVHTTSDVRWQAMAGLAYGYTGHVWFLYQVANSGRHPTAARWGGSALHDGHGDWAAPRTPLWGAVAAVNRELANLGRTLRVLRSTAVRYDPAPTSAVPFRTTRWTLGAGGHPYLTAVAPAPDQDPMNVLAGFFVAPDGDQYVMVQNARHTHSDGGAAEPPPGADDPGRIRLEFDFAAAPPLVDRTRIRYMDPATGDIRDVGLTQLPPPPPPPPPPGEPPPEEPPPPPPSTRYEVEVTLAPGGVLLFKHANTIPFRLGRDLASVGVVDPGQGRWYLRDALTTNSFYYGNPGDVPFMGDWDCDGIATPGLFRASDGFAYLRNSNSVGIADVEFFVGNPDDVPLAGDFDGDGCDTISLYRRAEGRFFVFNRLGEGLAGLGAADFSIFVGDLGDEPFVGDFDGNGVDSFGLHRRSTGEVFLRNALTTGAADVRVVYGDPGDIVIPGDWDGDGVTTLGLYRAGESRFYLRFSNTGGPADLAYTYGDPGFVPVAGVLN